MYAIRSYYVTGLADKLCQSVAQEIIEVENSTVGITLSIGIYPLQTGNQDSRSIIAHAQIASRQAQEEGGNRVKVVKPEAKPHTVLDDGAQIASLIERGFEENLFEVFFQPIVALQGSPDAHYQTLIRLQEPDGKRNNFV